MTTITFKPTSRTTFVSWGDRSIWSPAVVPNSAHVDVVTPTIYRNHSPYTYFISVGNGQNYNILSLEMEAQILSLDGGLSVSGDLNEQGSAEITMDGGSLSAGSLEVQGNDLQGGGVVNVAGALTVDSEIVGDGLTVNAANLTNKGTLDAATGDLTINVGSGGFKNLTAGVLTGGIYEAGHAPNTTPNSDVLLMNVGQVVTKDAATIGLDASGEIEFFDPATQQYETIQATLKTITKRGVLNIGGISAGSSTPQFGSLQDDGAISLDGVPDFAPTSLRIGPDGSLGGIGTVNTAIVNDGIIDANVNIPFGLQRATDLVINAPVTGKGHFKIDGVETSNATFLGGTLELAGRQSEDVVFANDAGTLQLDAPKRFTGNIVASSVLSGVGADGTEDISSFVLALHGIAYSSVTGYSYSGGDNSGVLSIDTTTQDYSFNYVGNLQTSDFTLSAGPQTTLDVTVTPYTEASLFGSFVQNFSRAQGEVYALYEGVLGQAPDPLGFENSTAALQGGQSLASVALGLLGSAEFTAEFGNYAQLSNKQFIDDLYETALHRPPDAAGLHNYENALANGLSRQQVALDVALSSEAEADLSPSLNQGVFAPSSTDAQIARLYYGLLDRAPDASGLAGWEAGVANGMSLTTVAQDFLNSVEYEVINGSGPRHDPPPDSQFLTELYREALGRAPDAAGFQSWSAALSSGMSRASVALGIIESSEAQQHLAGSIEVGMKVA